MKSAASQTAKLILLTILVGIFLSGKTVLAIKYRPKPEETLSHVSLIHYGDPKKFIYIAAANGIRDPDKLPRGKKLWVPTVWRYRIKKGDHLSRISAKYLKDKNRSDFLMWLNRIRDPKEVKVGSLITIPFLLRHRVKPGESMVDVARRYYFQTKPAGLLRKFNGKRTNALKPGESVLVPIYDPDATYEKVTERMKRYQEKVAKTTGDQPKLQPKPEEVAQPEEAAFEHEDSLQAKITEEPNGGSEAAPPEEFRVTPSEDAALVQKSFKLYRDGEYELARSNLSRVLDLDRLSEADEAEAREILAFCLVAMDRPKEAEHEFVRLLMVAPDRTLDPVTTSPKILEVFNRARGIK